MPRDTAKYTEKERLDLKCPGSLCPLLQRSWRKSRQRQDSLKGNNKRDVRKWKPETELGEELGTSGPLGFLCLGSPTSAWEQRAPMSTSSHQNSKGEPVIG